MIRRATKMVITSTQANSIDVSGMCRAQIECAAIVPWCDWVGLNPAAKPTGDGCVECLAGWWLHLRGCAECGHICCCDSSPSQYASGHAQETGHPIIASFEPGEDWFYDYESGEMIEGPNLAPARSHPKDQPVQGPRSEQLVG